MPRNPAWTDEEIILATELYVRSEGRVLGPSHPDVIKLSELLNSLPLHGTNDRQEKFRNPSGIGMKLSNIRAADPDREGGSSHGSKRDGLFWSRLDGDPAALSREVAAIYQKYGQNLESDSMTAHTDSPFAPINGRLPLYPDTATPRHLAVIREEADAQVVVKPKAIPKSLRVLLRDAYQEIPSADPRFRWFTDKLELTNIRVFQTLYELVKAKLEAGMLEPASRGWLTELSDYADYLGDMTLEEELFSILANRVDPDEVDDILTELSWSAKRADNHDGVSYAAQYALELISEESWWTPAFDRSLAVLERSPIRNERDVRFALAGTGVSGTSSFSLDGLRHACRAFNKTLPLSVQLLSTQSGS